MHSQQANSAALIGRLLAHYWTTNEPQEVRRAIAEDWLEDLGEFPAAAVEAACREWRRTQTRRPTPADIRTLCIAEQQAEREHRLAIADHHAAWPPWLADLWGPVPEGPRLRAEATKRIKRTLGESVE